MQQIKINIQEEYLATFLEFLKTLNYLEVEGTPKKRKLGEERLKKGVLDPILKQLTSSNVSLEGIKPIVKGHLTIEQLMEQKGYKGFDRRRFDEIIERLDIQEPIDVLLSQLTQ